MDWIRKIEKCRFEPIHLYSAIMGSIEELRSRNEAISILSTYIISQEWIAPSRLLPPYFHQICHDTYRVKCYYAPKTMKIIFLTDNKANIMAHLVP